MDRRRFLATLAGAFAAPRAAAAQPPVKLARIGVLVIGSMGSPAVALSLDAFRQGLLGLTIPQSLARADQVIE